MSRIHLFSLLFITLSAQAQTPRPDAASQPVAFTGIRGTLKDKKTGEPLMVAPVKVTRGTSTPISVETDFDGNFAIPLPPGTYDLRFWADGYKGLDVVGAKVLGSNATVIDMQLAPIDEILEAEELVVTAEVDPRAEQTALSGRQLRATVSDALSAQELSRSGDSNAADAVKRVVGVTVARDQSVSLRGLGGRYAATLVNGVQLPSADPDGHQAPIDLLPTGMLESITLQKSYGAKLPGAFAGGALAMETNTFPADLQLSAKLSTGGNSVATMRERHAYAGGSLDFLGIDDGTRSLPTQIPTEGPITHSSARELTTAFRDVWTVQRQRVMPNLGLGITVGNTTTLSTAKLGYLASVGVGHSEVRRRSVVKKPSANGEELSEDLRVHTGGEAGTLNGLVNLGLSPDGDNDLGLLSLYTRTGHSSAEVAAGEVFANNPEVATRLQFEERALFFNQLRGTHRLSGGDSGTVKWQANYSTVNANEPDTRDVKYELLGGGRERFKQGTGSAERFYSWLRDQSFGGSAEYRRRVFDATVTTGVSAQRSVRQYDARRFRYTYVGTSAANLFLPADQLLTGESLRQNFQLREATLPNDSYFGAQGVFGAFASGEVRLLGRLRASLGLRFEAATQEIVTGSPYFSGTQQSQSATRMDPAVLPAANLVYALSHAQNLRAGYSYTTIRPQFRELSPVLYVDFVRRRNVTGNPELTPSRIHNGDLRWEWFPSALEVVAASVFYKRFQAPIEAVIVDAHGSTSFANTPGAWSAGLELEGRVGMERLWASLSGLRAGANLSVIRSEITAAAGETVATTSVRPLQGQAPWVVNASIGYAREAWGVDVNLLYNVAGPTLSEVGANYLPNAIERPFHSLDLTAHKTLGRGVQLKLTARNLLDQAVVIEQAGVESLHFRPGISGSLAVEWAH